MHQFQPEPTQNSAAAAEAYSNHEDQPKLHENSHKLYEGSFKFDGMSMETETTICSEIPNEGKATVEQILGPRKEQDCGSHSLGSGKES